MKSGESENAGGLIGAAFGWRQVNGWEKLRRIIGSIPNAIPHVLTVPVDVVLTGGITGDLAEFTGSATAIVPPECEFYCLQTTTSSYRIGETAQNTMFDAPGNTTAAQVSEATPAKVLLQYERGGYKWSNTAVSLGHIFGTGNRPYIWPAPWIIAGGTTIKATITQRQLGNATYRHYLNFIGFKRFNIDAPLATDFLLSPRILDLIRRAKSQRGNVRVEPYVYALNFDSLEDSQSTFGPRVAHGVEQQTFAVSEADFAIVEQMATVRTYGLIAGVSFQGINTSPQNTIKITLDVGRRRVDDRAVPIVSIFGTGRRPFRYGCPLVVPRGGDLTAFVSFEKQSSAAQTLADNAYLTFSGVRLFPTGDR